MRFLLLVLIGGPLALAQTVSTQILGLVTDASGAIVSGAQVSARRVETGDLRTTRSNETGNYVFPILDVGEYEVTCTAAGFKTEIRRGVVLQLQQKARLDFQLQVGAQVERVEVTSAIPLLRTEDATLGSVVEHKRIVELPLNGRNFAQTATLMPGVVYGSSRMGQDGQQTIGTRAMPGQIVGLSANGQRDTNQNITLNGVAAVDGFKSAMLFVPSIEAIEEFNGRFSFTGLRDGYYSLALLSPEGASAQTLSSLLVRGDPGVFRLEPGRKTRDVGVIAVTY